MVNGNRRWRENSEHTVWCTAGDLETEQTQKRVRRRTASRVTMLVLPIQRGYRCIFTGLSDSGVKSMEEGETASQAVKMSWIGCEAATGKDLSCAAAPMHLGGQQGGTAPTLQPVPFDTASECSGVRIAACRYQEACGLYMAVNVNRGFRLLIWVSRINDAPLAKGTPSQPHPSCSTTSQSTQQIRIASIHACVWFGRRGLGRPAVRQI